ncbi:MAG: right-handed parallel beta-helix repeat-containing protein [Acidobacteriaceae bacterium]
MDLSTYQKAAYHVSKGLIYAALVAGSAVTLYGVPALAQANVVENEPATIYVDATAGSDSNPGTQALPLKTVSAGTSFAVRNNVQGIGTKVIVNPGVYREYVNVVANYRGTSAPITIQAAQFGTAIVAGSDVFTNWYQGTNNSAIYTHSWTYGFGNCPISSGYPQTMKPILRRREMVFVNGIPLTQVMALSQMLAGTFYVDETSQQIQIWPRPGTDMNTALVEVAVRSDTFNISRQGNIVVRGMTFEHAASCIDKSGVNVNSANNVLIDSIQANWNNQGGFHVSSSTNVTVQNSAASHNGSNGFGGYRSKQVLFQFDEADYNNWRGAQAAFYDYYMGGMKFFNMHGATVDQFFAYNNQGQGLWFDTDNRQIVAQGSFLSGNWVANLQVELNAGPIAVLNNTLCYGQVGVNLVNASNITFSGNTFYNNGGSTAHMTPQFYLEGKAGGRNFTDYETGVFYNVISSNITLNNNVFENGGLYQQVFATYQVGSDWAAFVTTLKSNNNHWFDPFTVNGFEMNGKKFGLTSWQGYTGQDMASTWGHTNHIGKTCVAPPTDFPDFAMYSDNSAYAVNGGQANINLTLKPYISAVALTKGLTSPTASGYPVSLSVSGLPSGFNSSFSAPAASPAGFASRLTVTAPAGTPQQTIPITVFAQGAGQVHSITLDLTVNAGTNTGRIVKQGGLLESETKPVLPAPVHSKGVATIGIDAEAAISHHAPQLRAVAVVASAVR